MKAIRVFVIFTFIGAAAVAAQAQTRGGSRSEVTFEIVSATVEKFARPIPTRGGGAYSTALALRVAVAPGDLDALPPSLLPFLYIGTHELRPFMLTLERERVIMTFHDPNWQKLQGGEPMVITVNEGDPINNPDRYAGYPPFDPRIIR